MAVNQALKDAIRAIKFKRSIKQDQIAGSLGVAPTYLSDMINGRVPLSNALNERLYELYSDCLSGDKKDVDVTNVADTNIVEATIVPDNEALDVNIDALMRDKNLTELQVGTIIGESSEYVSTCYGKLLPRHIECLGKHFGVNEIDKYVAYPKSKTTEVEIIEAFPIVSEAVTTDPNTNIVKYVEENGDELETINPNQLLTDAKVTIAERIKRTSMLPTFQPDDIVFVRILKDKMKIVDGETYYLDCKNRPTMIRLVKFEGCDKLRLIAKNPQYGDIVIDRADIINIGVVAALFRMTFGDQYSEIEAVRRKKDEHLERMMDMLERKEDQQSKLIDFITKK